MRLDGIADLHRIEADTMYQCQLQFGLLVHRDRLRYQVGNASAYLRELAEDQFVLKL